MKELGDILRELTASQLATGERLNLQIAQRIEEAANRQVAAAREDNQVLGDVIAVSIEKSLKGPLEDIASSVKTATGDQRLRRPDAQRRDGQLQSTAERSLRRTDQRHQ